MSIKSSPSCKVAKSQGMSERSCQHIFQSRRSLATRSHENRWHRSSHLVTTSKQSAETTKVAEGLEHSSADSHQPPRLSAAREPAQMEIGHDSLPFCRGPLSARTNAQQQRGKHKPDLASKTLHQPVHRKWRFFGPVTRDVKTVSPARSIATLFHATPPHLSNHKSLSYKTPFSVYHVCLGMYWLGTAA